MRYGISVALTWCLLVLVKLTVASQLTLPDCAVSAIPSYSCSTYERGFDRSLQESCYNSPSIVQAQCTFADNECTCESSPLGDDIESCVLQTCTVREWLGKPDFNSNLQDDWQ